jgi:hypothetical protein
VTEAETILRQSIVIDRYGIPNTHTHVLDELVL